ncbi:unnamed protein product [Didymodactylos carnosus]|uniref:Integrase zinc-binding domain-containing protein n=1 Tax=Didymodactylos carnosus TaxID=1234261 RepID=A0A8S2E1A7_9BILA|nr:unnamed protein product [Didymodactylos carnosus]CAF3871702.1 unnamed protein product [Didymodactylos carnosus]
MFQETTVGQNWTVTPGNNGSIVASVALPDHCIAGSTDATEAHDLTVVSNALVSGSALSASVSVSTIFIFDNQEKLFYDEIDKHFNTLNEKFRQKAVIKKDIFDSILKVLRAEKGKSVEGVNGSFVYWSRKNFILREISGVEIVCCVKFKQPVCKYESFYNIVNESHEKISHGGRDKTLAEILAHYSWIPKIVVEIYLKYCISCQNQKPVKTPVVSKPILSLGVLTRLQIDMRTRPDCISSDVVYQWILRCTDHYSKYPWAYPLVDKSAGGAAKKLLELFFTFGPQKLLHSDNGAAHKVEQYKVGACVGIKISEVDRTNIDVKLLPCLILSKEKKDDDFIFRIACKFGKFAIAYTVESLIDLR